MKRRVQLQCTHPGCKEHSYVEYSNVKETIADYSRRQKWLCIRHSNPEDVLSLTNLKRESIVTVTELNGHHYWQTLGQVKSGFTYGEGYKVYAEDFPIGTKLKITAEIIP